MFARQFHNFHYIVVAVCKNTHRFLNFEDITVRIFQFTIRYCIHKLNLLIIIRTDTLQRKNRMAHYTTCVQRTINKCIQAEPLEQGGAAERQGRLWFAWWLWYARGFPRAESDCVKLHSLRWDVLDRYMHALANHKAHIHFTVEWWVSGKSSNTHLHGCALLGSSDFRGGEKCLHSGTFCYPIKHIAQA